jgi:hypothetical protein
MWVVPAGTAGRGKVKLHMKVDTADPNMTNTRGIARGPPCITTPSSCSKNTRSGNARRTCTPCSNIGLPCCVNVRSTNWYWVCMGRGETLNT